MKGDIESRRERRTSLKIIYLSIGTCEVRACNCRQLVRWWSAVATTASNAVSIVPSRVNYKFVECDINNRLNYKFVEFGAPYIID